MVKESKVLSQVKKYMKKQDYVFASSGDALRGLEGGDNAQWQWIIHMHSQGGGIVSYCGHCPLKVPARRRAAVAEYLTRVNWLLSFGNFEMDWSDGRAIFRAGIPVTASGVSEKAIEHLVYAPYFAMDRYLPGLLAVALGNAHPEKMVAEAVSGPSAPPDDEQGNAQKKVTPEESIGAPQTPGRGDSEPPNPSRRSRIFGADN